MKNKLLRGSLRHKRNKSTNVIWLILSGLFGVVASVVLLLLVAVFIKDSGPDEGAVSVISSIIKVISCFVCVYAVLPKVDIQPMLSGIISSTICMTVSTFLFLALSGDAFDLRVFIVDILISLICGVLFSLILYKKSLFVKNK